MTTFNICKKFIPKGTGLVLVKEKKSEFECELVYGELKAKTFIPKAFEPGKAPKYCKMAICTAMMCISLQMNDLEMAKKWNDRQKNLKEWPKDNYEP